MRDEVPLCSSLADHADLLPDKSALQFVAAARFVYSNMHGMPLRVPKQLS
jgi:hypothetical protein